MERRVSPWIEVAPALLISPQKPSTLSSKLETIFEEGSDNTCGGQSSDTQRQRRNLLFHLFFSSVLLFIQMWFHGMMSLMKNHQILSWIQRMEIEPKQRANDKSSSSSSSGKTIRVRGGIKLF